MSRRGDPCPALAKYSHLVAQPVLVACATIFGYKENLNEPRRSLKIRFLLEQMLHGVVNCG